jgi:uncharacterized protein YbjQ (UPF0145 family)
MARMSRFQKELSGQLGEKWQRIAQARIEAAKEMFENDVRIDENGAVCWKSNGHYIMDDMIEQMVAAGCQFNIEATRKAREEQNAKFAAEYIKQYIKQQTNRQPSAEEMSEMRAAFGADAVVVDVISGRKIQL